MSKKHKKHDQFQSLRIQLVVAEIDRVMDRLDQKLQVWQQILADKEASAWQGDIPAGGRSVTP